MRPHEKQNQNYNKQKKKQQKLKMKISSEKSKKRIKELTRTPSTTHGCIHWLIEQ